MRSGLCTQHRPAGERENCFVQYFWLRRAQLIINHQKVQRGLVLNHKRWHILPTVPRGHPLGKCGLSPLMTQILFNRGLADAAQVEPFLRVDKRLSPDPFLLPDMEIAVTRIYRAVLGGEKIAIYGDFDADGITSTAVLVQGLRVFNVEAIPYIPHRINEGHGLKISALENLKREGVSLVITTDCGITGVNPVKKARRLGIDVIVTDHHTPTEELPPALALINPKIAACRSGPPAGLQRRQTAQVSNRRRCVRRGGIRSEPCARRRRCSERAWIRVAGSR